MGYSLNSLIKGVYIGSIIGVTKGDARSSDYSSYGLVLCSYEVAPATGCARVCPRTRECICKGLIYRGNTPASSDSKL